MRARLPAFILAFCLTRAVAAVQVTDDRGVILKLPNPPQRVVSMLPSLTESVCELGACERLVGVDRYSNFPAPVRALPRVGGAIDPNIEAVISLRPEVVLMGTSGRGAERLEALGMKVLALEPQSLADVRRVLFTLGQLLAVADAQRIWRAIETEVDLAKRSLPASIHGERVYFEVSAGPYAAGPRSFIGELLQRLGTDNVIAPDLGPFPLVNPEYVVRRDPDLIMIAEGDAQRLAQRPGWAGMRALRSGRVCEFDAHERDVLVRPGPRMAEAARLLARCLGAAPGTSWRDGLRKPSIFPPN